MSDDGWRTLPLVPGRLTMVSWGPDRRAAEEVYRPLRMAARMGTWMRRRGLAGAGRAAPAPGVMHHEVVARHLADASGLAVMAGSAGRSLVGVARGGRLDWVIKVGSTDDDALANEARWLQRSDLPVQLPRLLAHEHHAGRQAVVSEAVDGWWRAELPSVDEVVELCAALQTRGRPVVHGDLAPWNVAPAEHGHVVIDWERATERRDPVGDLVYHLVQREGQLKRAPDPLRVVRWLSEEDGPVGRCLERQGIDPVRSAGLARPALEAGRALTAHAPTRRLYEDVAELLGD